MRFPFVIRAMSLLWQAICRFVSSREDGIRGVASIELAIIAPMLLLFLVCTLDLGLGVYSGMRVQNAAQAGIQYAVAHGFKPGSISSAVTNATSLADISVDPEPSQFCGCPGSTGITSAACGATCPSGLQAATYVTVSARATYNTLFPYPLIPNSFTFLAQPTVRIQ